MSSIVFRSFSAVIVARTMLIGVRLPMHLERISLMPASSSTARTGPPAITPLPSAAGRRNTSPAPYVPVISCGIVVPITGTLNRFFLASSSALRIASGTSFAFPVQKPTRPFLSPITTRAAKRKRRPPLTTFVTRLIVTTRVSNSFSRSRSLLGLRSIRITSLKISGRLL